MSKTARVGLAEGLSVKQLHNCIKEIHMQIGAICDISTRRAGYLLNQESRGKHAARVICEASDRARAQFSSHAEKQALPVMRVELLRADIKALAAKKRGKPASRIDSLSADEGKAASEESSASKSKAEKSRERRIRKKEGEKRAAAETHATKASPSSEDQSSKTTSGKKRAPDAKEQRRSATA